MKQTRTYPTKYLLSIFSCKSLHYYSLCFLLSFSPAGREIADSRHVFQNPVKSFVRVLSWNINVMLGNLRAFPRILACLSDLQIILSRKLAKSLSLENVILVRLCQLRVAVLSHFCHLQTRKNQFWGMVQFSSLLIAGASHQPGFVKDQPIIQWNMQCSSYDWSTAIINVCRNKSWKCQSKAKGVQDQFLPSLVLCKVIVLVVVEGWCI